MPVSKPSRSAPAFLKESVRCARNAGLGTYKAGKRIVKTTKSPTQAAGAAAVIAGATLLFPIPMAIVGAIHVLDDALHGDEVSDDVKSAIAQELSKLQPAKKNSRTKKKKDTSGPLAGAPAAAAG